MTTFKTLTIAAVLVALPGLTFAMGCSHGKHQQVQSCISGTAWDADTQSCVPLANS